ncbi:hypothetical protein [Roseovarius sp. M141]|uniref:hypothetical protein n=1 Tax=Roseovarius sp. M141 TaxID=2583806 RepID=UPI0020CBCEE4|nr:hypothetical protein [Roseovarius sp. M141]MCQ0090347.1 hypothetical protein [Roseovarius sp. M141]
MRKPFPSMRPRPSWRPVLVRSMVSLGFTTLWATQAFAQTFGDIFTEMRSSQLGPAADILGTISFVLGVVFAIMAVMAMIKRSRSANDSSVETGRILMLSVAAACMVAIPTFLNVGVASIFGTGANQSSVDGQLRSLN